MPWAMSWKACSVEMERAFWRTSLKAFSMVLATPLRVRREERMTKEAMVWRTEIPEVYGPWLTDERWLERCASS